MARRTPRRGPTEAPPPDPPDFTDEELLNVIATLAAETNPWIYLDVVRKRVPLVERATYLERWLKLVEDKALPERDALLGEGQPVFRYTMGTIRDEMKRRDKASSGDTRAVASVGPKQGAEGFLAEMIYRRGETPNTGFLVHRFDKPDASPEFVERIQIGSQTFIPLSGSLAGGERHQVPRRSGELRVA